MANIIWNRFSHQEQQEYIEFLKIFGALSGLFKDNLEGKNARKPYLYYRNHEQLFARIFDVKDLTRKDSAFDALGIWDDERIGIGLKTWIHTKDFTYQKVAEFNKKAPEVIDPLIEAGTPEEVVKKVAELRNIRIMLDKRLYKTNTDVYHFITRDDDVMKIIETQYDLIDLKSIQLLSSNGKTYSFKDKLHRYKFYRSKSVLLEEFNASSGEVVAEIPIKQFDDPFELIRMIELPSDYSYTADDSGGIIKWKNIELSSEDSYAVDGSGDVIRYPNIINSKNVADTDGAFKNFNEQQNNHQVIYLPLYQDKKDCRLVSPCSGINIRHSKPKSKGSNTPRPEYEIEVRVSKWIHYIFPNFFGIDALNDQHIRDQIRNDFDLVLPDGRALRGRIKQQGGKSLQTNPQSALGEWILKDVLGLENREVVTWELLNDLGIDSLKITKINDKTFNITVAEAGAYEKFKLDNKHAIEAKGLTGRQKPYFKPEIIKTLKGNIE